MSRRTICNGVDAYNYLIWRKILMRYGEELEHRVQYVFQSHSDYTFMTCIA